MVRPLLALLAGIITSIIPCALTSVPFVIGYVGGTAQKDTKKAFKLSVVFSIGMAITFMGFVHKLSSSKRYGIASKVLRILMGLAIAIIAFYMFYLGF